MRLAGLKTEPEVAAAARSALYLRLVRALSFPEPPLVEELASGDFLAGLEGEAALLPYTFDLTPAERGALAGPTLAHDEVQQEYIRLFEVGPGRPPCPLYEGSHRSGRMKIMEETVRFYEHFGLRTQPGDQPDHLCAELEFMHYLAFKEAALLSSGAETAGLAAAQRDFLSRRLCGWLPRLRQRAEGCGAAPLYAALLGLAERYCRVDEGALRERGAKPDAKSGSCLTDGGMPIAG
jgi:DMSO reductase family type II enzyme chaperone